MLQISGRKDFEKSNWLRITSAKLVIDEISFDDVHDNVEVMKEFQGSMKPCRQYDDYCYCADGSHMRPKGKAPR
jgi:hypothetical protein